MGKLLQAVVEILIIIFFISDIIIPLFLNKPLFGTFRRKTPLAQQKQEGETQTPLETEIKQTQEEVEKAKQKFNETKQKVDDHFNHAKDMKEKTDEIL